MDALRILVDPQIFAYGRCGMTRYYGALCAGLRAAGHDVRLPLWVSGSDFLPGAWGAMREGRLTLFAGSRFPLRLPARLSRWIARLSASASRRRYVAELRRGDHDLVLVTSPVFEDAFLAPLGAKPFVMVVHDTMRCVLGPDGLFDPAGENAERLAFLARRASRVVCISEATRRDLLTLSAMDAERCRVVHTGQLLQLDAAPAEAPSVPERFILFVGDRTGRKNFRGLAQAAAPLLRAEPDLFIVCAGGALNPWERDWLKLLGIEAQVKTVEASDAQLVQLYRRALCLAYPSLYEGFGLPVLEAMALGCPVLTSPSSSLPEVAGDDACYADPHSPEAIGQALFELVHSPERRAELSARGRERAERFAFSAMLARFEAVFAEAVQGAPARGPAVEPEPEPAPAR